MVISMLASNGSANGLADLSAVWCQDITWTNADFCPIDNRKYYDKILFKI